MNYKEAIDWLYSFEKHGVKLGLERVQHLCKKLGDPQKNYHVIHVGGTNGKGSVCNLIGSVLISAGYSVGIYTSPHIQRFSERMIVDCDEISEIEIVLLVDKIKPIVEEMVNKDNIPTFFEIVTTMVFQYFYDKKVDYALIEVGLGGRFDATNIVIPMVSVITNVSLEHQDRLGKTIKEIAYEKAGIIKENIPVLTGSEGVSLKVIEKIAGEKKAPLTIIKSGSWEKIGGGVDWQSFIIHGKFKDYHIKTHLQGLFQAENLTLALGCIEVIQMSGVYITDENIIEGIKQTKNPGRMEIISFEPLILLDGAHNIASMNMLKNIIVTDFAYDRLILIIGILSDKNIKKMIEIISPISDIVIITKSSNSRACEPEKLKDFFYNDKVVITNSVSEAVEHAKKIANKQDMVLITGSLFTVGEARDILI